MKKIGILGGTFDPVHYGHIGLANDASEEAGLDEVIMIPAKIQPFKRDRRITSGEDRFEMVDLVADQYDGISVSEFELRQDSVSYTYLTMRHMQELYSDAKLYFISGTDSFLKIESWTNADELLERYSYIVGTRPGYRQDELKETMERVNLKFGTEVINIHNRQMDISATVIRKRLASDEPIDDLVPRVVERYIREHGLYTI